MEKALKEISIIAIPLNRSVFTDEQKSLQWLGSQPASRAAIALAERRLNTDLPEDYLKFLLITNGFFTPCDSTEPTFENVSKIDYLKNVDPFLIEIWQQEPLIEEGRKLARSIVVAGLNDEQYFLLIPPDVDNKKWEYWKFASWIPGEESYNGLESYFVSVLDFIKTVE
ncbi:MAG: SMI1/KNR4 family protein [Sphingobacteriales bacterium]